MLTHDDFDRPLAATSETLPIYLDGVRVAELRFDRDAAADAVRRKAVASLAGVVSRQFLRTCVVKTRRLIHQDAELLAERAFVRAAHGARDDDRVLAEKLRAMLRPKKRGGRPRKLDAKQIREVHAEILPTVTAIVGIMANHRNGSAAWRTLMEKIPEAAAELEQLGLKPQLIDAGARPTPNKLADALIAGWAGSTPGSIRDKRVRRR